MDPTVCFFFPVDFVKARRSVRFQKSLFFAGLTTQRWVEIKRWRVQVSRDSHTPNMVGDGIFVFGFAKFFWDLDVNIQV